MVSNGVLQNKLNKSDRIYGQSVTYRGPNRLHKSDVKVCWALAGAFFDELIIGEKS